MTGVGAAGVADAIDEIVGIVSGGRLDGIRRRRPDARENAQRTFEALFAPEDDSQFSLEERAAVAVFVAGLHAVPAAERFYAAQLAELGGAAWSEAIADEAVRGGALGPYGVYREARLAGESSEGDTFAIGDENRGVLGARLAGALEHAHLLVFHPRDVRPESLDRLLASGWSTPGVVALSQLVAYLAFQLRVVAGLTVIDADQPGRDNDQAGRDNDQEGSLDD